MNIIEGIQHEVVRVREIIQIYKDVPNGAGSFASVCMQANIDNAEKAVATGDTIAMIAEYKQLKEWEL